MVLPIRYHERRLSVAKVLTIVIRKFELFLTVIPIILQVTNVRPGHVYKAPIVRSAVRQFLGGTQWRG
jgi:hypothetical protein